ncbi:YecA family protein [bacterium]|nr:YecA family protein [bacterium]
MSLTEPLMQLPPYQQFVDSIAVLDLPISGSELHGVICGYLAAGAIQKGEMYLRALMMNRNEMATRAAALALFNVFTVSQQQVNYLGFEFQLLLPDEDESLIVRAQAFSEWCEGFTQGLTLSEIDYNQLEDEEAQEAIHHLIEFAHLDYTSLQVDEADEQALMEVTEYARMAVLHIHSGVQTAHLKQDIPDGLPN